MDIPAPLSCSLVGKHTLRAASNSSDAVCEDRRLPTTLSGEPQGPPALPPTAQPTTAWLRTSQAPSTPPTEPPKGKGDCHRPSRAPPMEREWGSMELPSGLAGALLPAVRLPPADPAAAIPFLAGPELAAVLGLGLGLGLLGPVAAALVLLLHCKVCRLLPAANKPPGECLLSLATRCPRAKAPLTTHRLLFPPPQGETASGPPSKRSMPMPTVPWPRSERCRRGGKIVGVPPGTGRSTLSPAHPVTCPAPL